MKAVAAFLQEYWAALLSLVSAVVCFLTVFFLYDLPLEAVGYAALLSVTAMALIAGVALYRMHRRRRQILRLRQETEAAFDRLPPPESRLEAEYQALVQQLWDEKTRLATNFDRRADEMTDYYTLWAHQIKTPIAAMRLLLQSEDSETNRELTGELFRVEQYVEMALGYLRLDSDQTDYVLRRCDLDCVVRQAVRKYAASFIRRHIRLEYEAVHATALTDEKWLAFVVEQLLSNALKYTPDGGVVSVRLEEGHTLVITDTGIGIAPEDLPRVFDRGYTGYNGRTDKKSTGIGLYLCRRVTGKLGHALTLNSTPGQGTQARINLSRAEVEIND